MKVVRFHIPHQGLFHCFQQSTLASALFPLERRNKADVPTETTAHKLTHVYTPPKTTAAGGGADFRFEVHFILNMPPYNVICCHYTEVQEGV